MSNEVWYREKGVTHEISGSHSAVAADSGLVGCGTVFQVLTVLSLRIQVLWDVALHCRITLPSSFKGPAVNVFWTADPVTALHPGRLESSRHNVSFTHA